MPDGLEDYIKVIPERTTGGTKVYTMEVLPDETLRLRIAQGEVFFALTPSPGKKLTVQVSAYVEEVDA